MIRKTQTVKVNPHNTLKNGAYYFKCVVEKKVAAENYEGLFFDCAAGFLFLAFSVESVLNYIGKEQIKGFKERQSFDDKRKLVFKHLGLDAGTMGEEYTALKEVMDFRSTMAHGKPEVLEDEAILDGAAEVTEGSHIDLQPDWKSFAAEDTFLQKYELVMDVIKLMLEKTGIPKVEQFDSGSAHIEMVNPEAAAPKG